MALLVTDVEFENFASNSVSVLEKIQKDKEEGPLTIPSLWARIFLELTHLNRLVKLQVQVLIKTATRMHIY